MTVASGGTVVELDSAKTRLREKPGAIVKRKAQFATRRESRRERVVLTVPDASRRVKDFIWTAIFGISLACIAVAAGLVDVFVSADLVPLVQGAGLASIAFNLAGLSEKFDPHVRRDK